MVERVSGWATTDHLDMTRHSLLPTAFTESIRRRGLTGPQGIRLLLDHDRAKPAGVIRKLEHRGRGIWIEADLETDISYVRDRYLALDAAKGMSFSIGFRPIDFSIQEDRDGDDYLRLEKGDLFEVSVVTFPCNTAAEMVWQTRKQTPSIEESLAKMKRALGVKPDPVASLRKAQDTLAKLKESMKNG